MAPDKPPVRGALRVALGLALATGPAHEAAAHDRGTSSSTFEVAEDGRVRAKVAIPTADFARLAAVDRDGDGLLQSGEVAIIQAALQSSLAAAVEVVGERDGKAKACPGALDSVQISSPPDNIDLQGSYDCGDAERVRVRLNFLKSFTDTHRHAASISDWRGDTFAEVLRVTHVELAKTVREPRPWYASQYLRYALIGLASVVGGWLAMRRRRAAATS
jgi:hypothetical protein